MRCAAQAPASTAASSEWSAYAAGADRISARCQWTRKRRCGGRQRRKSPAISGYAADANIRRLRRNRRFRNLCAAAEAPSSAAALPAAAVSSLESAIRPGAASALQFAQALQSRLNAAACATCDALDERRLSLPRAFDIAQRLSALGASAAAVSRESVRIEAGDILYTAAQAGQLVGLDAEDALRRASARFYRRFKRMERICRQRRQDFGALPMDDKEALWRQAKTQVAGD